MKLKERWQTDPVWFAETILQEDLWDIQKEILCSVRDNVRTAVKTAHSIGKTRVAASVVLWFLYAHKNSEVITTAPTWRQVEELLWREIRQRVSGMRLKLPGKILQTELEIGDKWFATGISTKEPERFQGFHAEGSWLLIVIDESSGVDDMIFEAVKGLMSAGNVRLLLLGNPTRPCGEFFKAFNEKRRLYNTISVSAWQTPNLAPLAREYKSLRSRAERLAFLRSAPLPRPYLVSPSWVADMLEEFGAESPIFQVRVMGNFPPEAPDQLIPLHQIEEAQNRWDDAVKWWEIAEAERSKLKIVSVEIGIDVARYGDAETVFCGRAGDVVAPLTMFSKQDTMSTAGRALQYAQGIGASKVNIDVVGVGAGVYDRCKEMKLTGVTAVNVGEKPRDPEKFVNLRAEAYWNLRQRFERGEIALPPDQKLAGQLSSLKYKVTSNGKIQIETKEEARKRGVASPDRADALCLAFLPGSSRVSRAGSVGSYTFDWRQQ